MTHEDTPFHLTVTGRRFFESTVPALLRELERLNDNLERLRGGREPRSSTPVEPDSGRKTQG
jgi:hypothetical protein